MTPAAHWNVAFIIFGFIGIDPDVPLPYRIASGTVSMICWTASMAICFREREKVPQQQICPSCGLILKENGP